MAQQTINHGSVAGDGTGESPFSGMQKVNANFTELYAAKDAQAAALAAKAPLDNPTFTGTVNGITKAMVGLGNVDNVSDANKPVSTAQNTAIVTGDNLRLKASDMYGDFVVSGLATPVPNNTLDGVLAVGVAYVNGVRTERVAADTYTYLALRDTYVDMDSTGVLYRNAVVNGNAAPTLVAGRIRLEKVVTDGSRIISVVKQVAGKNDIEWARFNCDAIGTAIPNSTGVGTYNTKLLYNSIYKDTLGSVADPINHIFKIPAGYRFCKISYAVAFGIPDAWAANTAYALNAQRTPTTANGYFYRATTAGTSHATTEPTWPTTVGGTVVDGTVTWTCHANSEGVGWRGCRIKDEIGKNYGNSRVSSVSSDATTNPSYTTPWLDIVPTPNASNAPNAVHIGAQIGLYPAQTSGDTLNAGVDLASSWFHIELMR